LDEIDGTDNYQELVRQFRREVGSGRDPTEFFTWQPSPISSAQQIFLAGPEIADGSIYHVAHIKQVFFPPRSIAFVFFSSLSQ